MMKAVIVLQARTSSSRLPAKALLPISGYPMVVLAAKRAGNTGLPVIVATSSSDDDDVLVGLLSDYGVKHYRGSLDNVLERVVCSVQEYDDETPIVRLTADNVFPDGELIEAMLQEYEVRDIPYLSCSGETCGLPYGMSVEVVRLRYLKEASSGNTSSYEREHVTPYVIRKYGVRYFEKYKDVAKGHYRCTVDHYEDYIEISRVFADVDDPVSVPAFNLVDKLQDGKYQPITTVPAKKLVLGTAQLGMSYGIANHLGQPDLAETERILKFAIGNGVVSLDTARAYGESEERIGKCLDWGWAERVTVITKLDPFDGVGEEADSLLLAARVNSSVFESLARLRRPSIDVLLLHRADQLDAWNGVVWQRLVELRNTGVIGKIGVSVQSPCELPSALSNLDVSHIQLPFNILDYRWDAGIKAILRAREDRELTVHIRSAFLQGLLTSKKLRNWRKANINRPEAIWAWLEEAAAESGCKNVVDLCLRYCMSQLWVDGVVVGVENLDQLRLNLLSMSSPCIPQSEIRRLDSNRPKINELSLNPANWGQV